MNGPLTPAPETGGLPPLLRADCASCVALCCVGPAFDAAQGFGYDKPAHQPCRHLCPNSACAIHAERAARGFGGCEVFDCNGAGQRVTALFAGASWRDGAAVAEPMFAAFTRMRDLHELLVLLAVARRRVRGAEADAALAALQERVDAACRGPLDAFLQRAPQGLRTDVLQALQRWRAQIL